MSDKSTSHWPITLTNGFAAILNIFLPISLVRILPPDQVGRYKIFFLYVILGPGLFMTAGFSNGLYHWAGKYPQTKPELRQSWTHCLVIMLLCTALGFAIGEPLAKMLQVSVTDFRIFMLAMPFAMTALFFEDILIAKGNIWTGSWYSAGFSVLRTSTILAAALWTHRVETIFWTFLAVSALRVLVGWMILSPSGDITPLFSAEASRKVLRYALPVSLAAFASMGISNVDQMILSMRLTPAEFAFYAMGCLALPPLEILESSVNRILIPRMARAFAAADRVRAAELFSDAVAELWCFLLPATVGLVLYAKPIVSILFTERYAAAANYLRFFAFSYLITAVPFNSIARARADGAWMLKVTFYSAPLSLLLAFSATYLWGAMGALFSVLAISFSIRVVAMVYNRRCLELPYTSFLPVRRLWNQTLIALGASAVVLALHPLFHDDRWWFLTTGSIFTAAYFGATYALFLRRLAAAPGPTHVLQLAVDADKRSAEELLPFADALNRQERFRVTVASYGADPLPESPILRRFGVPLTHWRKSEGFSPLTLTRILRIILAENARVIHAHDLGPLIYGSIAKLLCFGHARLILTVHRLERDSRGSPYRFYHKMFLRFPDRIIAVSHEVQSALRELGVASHRVEVVAGPASASYAEIFTGGIVR